MKWLIVGTGFVVVSIVIIAILVKRKACNCRACCYYNRGYCSNKEIHKVSKKNEPCEDFVDTYY